MSPAKRPRPVTSGGSSSRSTDWPIHFVAPDCSFMGVHVACVLQRTADQGAHHVAAVVGAEARVVERIDGLAGLVPRGLEGAEVRRAADQHPLGLGDAARRGFGAADRDVHVAHHAVPQPVGDDRHGDGVVAGAAAVFGEARIGALRQDRQPDLAQQLAVLQRGRHDALEERPRRDDAGAADLALRHHVGVERRRHRAPFRGRIGVGDAAAERAAGADRVMRDMTDDGCEQPAERAVLNRLLECGMAHGGADAELAVLDHKAVEPGHAVDVDEMLRPRQPERHRRHETLPAGQHAAVVFGVLREQVERFRDGRGGVVLERGGLHRPGA